jgi:hypothetical protein
MLNFILLFILPFIIVFFGLVYTEYLKLKSNESLESYKLFVENSSLILISLISMLLIQIFIYYYEFIYGFMAIWVIAS